MASGVPYIGIFFCLVLQVIDCCNIFPFEDARCYVELVNGQYIVRGLPECTHMDFSNCVLVNGELNNPQNVHRPECDKTLKGHTVYVSSNVIYHARSEDLKRDANSSTFHFHSSNNYTCYNGHSYYRDIFGEAEHANCHRTYLVFQKLNYLRHNDHSCLLTLVREIAGLRLPNCECSNSSPNIHYSYTEHPDNYHYQCMTNHTYKEIVTSYLSHVPYNYGANEPSSKCHTRNQLWQDLLRLLNSDVHCFNGFIYHMREAFHAHSEPPCSSCHSPTTHTNVNQNYEAYIRGDCLSEHTVWSFLMEEYSNNYFGQSREQLIEQMAALYPDGTDNKCICSKKFDLQYPYLPYEDYQWDRRCRHSDTHFHTSFQNAITHLFGYHSTQTCHSHAAEAVYKHGDPCICNPVATTQKTETSTKITQQTLTQLTATQPTKSTTYQTTTAQSTATRIQPTTATLQQTTAPSPSTSYQIITTAHPNSTTTQKTTSTSQPTTTAQPTAMTSQPTTVAATLPTFHWVTLKNTSSSTVVVAHTTVCSKIHTIEELAKYQQIYPEFNTDCSNQISASNLIVRKLCPSVPVTQNWKPGFKVTESCDILKSYIPVATFNPSSEYPLDGLAGVFIGCTDSSIKIATQECGGRFSILELPRQPAQAESFTHTASNYHVVMY